MKVVVVHGYTSHCTAEWFPWLKEKLMDDKIEAIIPEMPDSDHPVLKTWLNHLSDTVSNIDEDTILVGHSLGCITLIRYLLERNQKVRGMILVSGFIEKNPMKVQTKDLSIFTEDKIDLSKIKALAPEMITITAIDDDIVPTKATQEMAEKLHTKLIVLQEGKHFIARDGYTSFPTVYEEIKKLI